MTHTARLTLDLYEIETDSGETVRFHDYEIEDGGIQLKWEFPRERFSPFPSSSSWSRGITRLDGDKRVVDTAFIPHCNLEESVISPMQIGEVVFKQDYEKQEREKGLIFKKKQHRYKRTGDPYIEYEPRTIIE